MLQCFLRETGENPVRARRREMQNGFHIRSRIRRHSHWEEDDREGLEVSIESKYLKRHNHFRYICECRKNEM